MAIIDPGDYAAIRASIDVTLDKSSLPDDTIGLSIYSEAADQDVISRVADAESKTGDDAKKIKRAAIFFCAARLIPSVIQLTTINIQVRDASFSRPAFDPEKRKDELIEMAEDELVDFAARTDPDEALTAGVIGLDFQQKGND